MRSESANIKFPKVSGKIQSEDCTNIIKHDDVDVHATSNSTIKETGKEIYNRPVWKRSLSRLTTAASNCFWISFLISSSDAGGRIVARIFFAMTSRTGFENRPHSLISANSPTT